MTTLTEFLLDRIAEDEAESRIADLPDEHFTAQRVLAECEAKRRIVELALIPLHEGGYGEGLELAVAYLALPYADHPDYDEEWRP